ncbi:MAG: sulfotransferase [Planctomycetota bacterium]
MSASNATGVKDETDRQSVQEVRLPTREDYRGVSCRPIDVAPGPADANRWLRLRCTLDTVLDKAEAKVRYVGVRGLGLGERIARGAGLGEAYRRIPGVRAWRTPVPMVRPIFIVGSERSGTTIVGKVLGHQGEVLFLNEPRPIWYQALPAINELKFHWREGEPQGKVYLDESDLCPQAQASLERAFGWIMRFAGRDRLMDKLPINLFRVRWLRAMWPDALFVQIMRDPFGSSASKSQIWSSNFENQSPGIAIRKRTFASLYPDLNEMLSTIKKPYEWFLFAWRVSTEEGERLSKLFPRQYCAVRLEDVQQVPEETLRGICEFAGLPFTERLRRAYKVMLDPRVRMAKPQISVERCRELLGESAARWGYEI